jgi:tetratricopeptide (TPR) repeat protein
MNQQLWPKKLAAFPYAQPLLIGWQIADHSKDEHWSEYEKALDNYLYSQNEALPLNKRYAELQKSKDLFVDLYAKGDRHIGTSLALVRIYSELGEHQAALEAIEQMLQMMPWLTEPLPESLQIQINRPFLAPIATYDGRMLRGDLGEWIQAAVLEAFEFLEGSQ